MCGGDKFRGRPSDAATIFSLPLSSKRFPFITSSNTVIPEGVHPQLLPSFPPELRSFYHLPSLHSSIIEIEYNPSTPLSYGRLPQFGTCTSFLRIRIKSIFGLTSFPLYSHETEVRGGQVGRWRGV